MDPGRRQGLCDCARQRRRLRFPCGRAAAGLAAALGRGRLPDGASSAGTLSARLGVRARRAATAGGCRGQGWRPSPRLAFALVCVRGSSSPRPTQQPSRGPECVLSAGTARAARRRPGCRAERSRRLLPRRCPSYAALRAASADWSRGFPRPFAPRLCASVTSGVLPQLGRTARP